MRTAMGTKHDKKRVLRKVCFVDTAADWEASRFESKRGFSAFNHNEALADCFQKVESGVGKQCLS